LQPLKLATSNLVSNLVSGVGCNNNFSTKLVGAAWLDYRSPQKNVLTLYHVTATAK